MQKIGIIAGNGQFPILFTKAAIAKGMNVYAIAHIGETNKELEALVQAIKWIHLGQLGQMVKFFNKHDVKQAVMVGAITKTRMFKDVRPDLKAIKLLNNLRHTKDDGVLRGLADYFEEKEGIEILESTFILPELLANEGCWTKRKPKKSELADMDFGWDLAKKIGKLDIGQCLVVQNRSVLAIEAIDGTDETILRGGSLGNGKAVVVKICKPDQDLRFDLPTIGAETIENMHKSGASVLLVEAGKSIVFNKEKTIELANKYKISIIGWKV